MSWQAESISGVGIGLRACHYPYILSNLPAVPWFEVLTENYMVDGGMVLERLRQIREHYPIVFHGVGMSLGSVDPLNKTYLLRLKQLIEHFQPTHISDHLCWTSFQQHYFHELLPLPYTEEAICHIAKRIRQVQDYLDQPILIENVSSYLTYTASQMSEWEFLNAIVDQSGCYILLDVNNVFVSAKNHGFDPKQYIKAINQHKVKQIHLAGFLDCDTHLLDNHGVPVSDEVWGLYQIATERLGQIPTCIEWDNDIPEFPVLLNEATKAQAYLFKYDAYPCFSPTLWRREVSSSDTLPIIQKQIFTALTAVPDQPGLTSILASHPQRLTIYQASITSALIATLKDTYSVCLKLVGDDFFMAMAKYFIFQTPSNSPDINQYGETFASFIDNFPPTKSLPYLADVAALEWAWHLALHGKDYHPWDNSKLTTLNDSQYGQVIFELPPNASLISSKYPVLDIWRMNQESDPNKQIPIDLKAGEAKLLVWRQAMDVHIDVLQAQEWSILKAIAEKQTIDELCASFYPIIGENLPSLLGSFVGKKWISLL